ncbi:hypothetical protein D3C81_2031810 [compost metagenome]
MFAGHIDVDEARNIECFSSRQGFGKAASRGFGHQVGFRSEMLVEPAVGEAGGRHEIRHTDAVEAALTKQLRGRFNDVLPIGLRLGLGHSHVQYLMCIGKSCPQ